MLDAYCVGRHLGGKPMKIWIVQYHHRHGVDVWPVISADAPNLDAMLRGVADFEEERGEFLESVGPFWVGTLEHSP
jgi:hypothetical protein